MESRERIEVSVVSPEPVRVNVRSLNGGTWHHVRDQMGADGLTYVYLFEKDQPSQENR